MDLSRHYLPWARSSEAVFLLQHLEESGDHGPSGSSWSRLPGGDPFRESCGNGGRLASLTMLEAPGVYEQLQHKTDLLTRPIKAYIEDKGLNVSLQQAGSMFTLFFGRKEVRSMEEAKELDVKEFARFFACSFSRIYFPPRSMKRLLFLWPIRRPTLNILRMLF